jgi:hypothetical protein
MKAIRNLANLFFAVLIATCLIPTAANAQSAFSGKFHLPEEARWGKAVLPAGDYAVIIENTQMPVRAIVRSAEGKTAAVAFAAVSTDADPGPSSIFITGLGSERLVRSMNVPQLGFTLIYEPLSKREREVLYRTATQSVVVVANK